MKRFKGKLMQSNDELDDVLTPAQQAALSERYGGTDLYVRKKVDARLSETVGQQASDKLAGRAGGSSIYVRQPNLAEIYERRLEMKILQHAGMSIDEISRHFRYQGRYTARNIYRILKG